MTAVRGGDGNAVRCEAETACVMAVSVRPCEAETASGTVRGGDGARHGRVSAVRAMTAARRCVEVRGGARNDDSGERRCGARRCGGSRTSVRENAGSCGSHINLFDRPFPPEGIQIPPAPQHNASGPAGLAGVRSRCRSLK